MPLYAELSQNSSRIYTLTVCELQAPLHPPASGLQPQPVLQHNKSMAAFLRSDQQLLQPQMPEQKAYLVKWEVILMRSDRGEFSVSVVAEGSLQRQHL